MSFTFVEYFGYALFKSLGTNIHEVGKRLLQNGALSVVYKTTSANEIKKKVLDEDFEKDDILCVLWYSFRHVVSEMLSSFWAESFRSASNRSRFIAHKETRQKIIRGLEDLHRYTCKMQITTLWAAGIETEKGIYGFIQDRLTKELNTITTR
jgi:hypothetical protein